MEHRFGELPAQAVYALAGQQQVEAVGSGIISPDRGARLDRGGEQPVVDEFDLDDMGCLRERRGDRRFVAALKPVRQIARRFVPKQRRLQGKRLPRLDHGR
jgi:hypothetical protein